MPMGNNLFYKENLLWIAKSMNANYKYLLSNAKIFVFLFSFCQSKKCLFFVFVFFSIRNISFLV